jgi:hypothetical protein
MAERKWTHEEATQLIQLAEAGLSVDEIGERLDRTSVAVRVKANRIGVDFYVRDIGKMLPCKMCGQPMNSTWSGHRICDDLQKDRAIRCA